MKKRIIQERLDNIFPLAVSIAEENKKDLFFIHHYNRFSVIGLSFRENTAEKTQQFHRVQTGEGFSFQEVFE